MIGGTAFMFVTFIFSLIVPVLVCALLYFLLKNAIKNGINESNLFSSRERIPDARRPSAQRISDAQRIMLAEERIAQLTAELAAYGWVGADQSENSQENAHRVLINSESEV